MARWVLLVGFLVAAACHEESPPSYLRLRGQAPALVGVEPSGARLLVFWATWCPPCRAETPALRALAADPPQGLRVVVLSHDEDLAAIERFFGGPPEAALNLRLDEGRAAAQALGVSQLPTSILIVDSSLVARFSGPREWDSRAMRKLLERLVHGAGESRPAPAVDSGMPAP